MYSCSYALGSAIQYTPYFKIPHAYIWLPQFDCTHYLMGFVLSFYLAELGYFSVAQKQIFKCVLPDF